MTNHLKSLETTTIDDISSLVGEMVRIHLVRDYKDYKFVPDSFNNLSRIISISYIDGEIIEINSRYLDLSNSSIYCLTSHNDNLRYIPKGGRIFNLLRKNILFFTLIDKINDDLDNF